MDDSGNSSEVFQSFPEAPEEQQAELDAEQSAVVASIPVIQEVLDWMAAVSKEFANTSSLNITLDTPAIDAKIAILSAATVKSQFDSKAQQFRTKFAQHLEERQD